MQKKPNDPRNHLPVTLKCLATLFFLVLTPGNLFILQAEFQPLTIKVKTSELGQWMSFIKPLNVARFNYKESDPGWTEVTLYCEGLLPPHNSPLPHVEMEKPHLPLAHKTPEVSSSQPKKTQVQLKLRDTEAFEIEKGIQNSEFKIVEKIEKKHGRLIWILESQDPDHEKAMRKFLRSLNYKYIRKETEYTIR